MKIIPPLPPDDLVMFNVRGRIFQTMLTTLRRFPDSVLHTMIEWSEAKHDQSPATGCSRPPEYYVDSDPDLFSAILHYHDTDEYCGESLDDVSSARFSTVTPKSLLLEAQYNNIRTLEQKSMQSDRQ